VFGFELRADADLAACREEAVAAGAVVLSESKRGAARLLACQDPAGNEFVLAVRVAVSKDEPVAGALVPVVAPKTGTEAGRPIQAPKTGPTRRDVDRLRDVERLASMQEAIAGLDVPFSTSDPASVLSDMKQKLGASLARRVEVDDADARLRAHEREVAAEELLARYRAQLAEPAESRAPEPTAAEPAVPDASASDDPVAADAPRTLGRSTRSDDD
jgi:hypothetical protein